MSKRTPSEIASKIADIDIAIFSTKSADGGVASRPMSNNSDVEYDGDSYYFTLEPTELVSDIERDPRVALAFSGKTGLLGGPPGFFAVVDGRADVIRDKEQFRKHWVADLDKWFEEGVDSPGLALIKVRAARIKYWDGMEEGTIEVAGATPGTKAA